MDCSKQVQDKEQRVRDKRPIMEHVAYGDDVHNKMAKYSVEKPIQVTCIFEDSDSDDKEEPAFNTSTDRNTNSVKEHLNTQSPNQKHVKNGNLDVNNKPNVQSNAQVEQTIHDNLKNDIYFPNTEQSYDDSSLRKLLNCAKNIPEYKHFKSNERRTIPENPTNNTSCSNEGQSYDDPPLKELFNSTKNIPDYKHLKSKEKKQFINLLDSVAENLIIITKYYHFFILKYGINHDAREKYLRYKNYYFEQSYSVLVTVFLPQENNKAFIKKFINRTIAIAKKKSWYHHMTVEKLTVFVNGMIHWAKLKKKYQEASADQLQKIISNQLEPPDEPILSTSNRHPNFEARQPYINRSLVPPKVSVPAAPPLSNYPLYDSTHRQYSRPPPVYRPPTTSSGQQWYEIPTSNRVSHDYAQQQMNRLPVIQPPSKTIPNVNTINQNNNPNRKSNQTENQKADLTNNICIFSAGMPGNKISISIDPTIAKSFVTEEVQKASHNQISKKRKAIDNPMTLPTNNTQCLHMNNKIPNHYSPNYSSQITNSDNEMHLYNNSNEFGSGIRLNNEESVSTECQTALLTRSVSRDSGLGSPALNSLLANNENNMAFPCSDNQKLSPEIPQITSLNSNALYNKIAPGACTICGSTTRNVCIACYKIYYCCSVCQTIDWPRHQKECKAR